MPFEVSLEVTIEIKNHFLLEPQGLFISHIQKYGLKAARRAPQFSKR